MRGCCQARSRKSSQAIGTPKGRQPASLICAQFVEEMKANGFVADALETFRTDRAGRTADKAEIRLLTGR